MANISAGECQGGGKTPEGDDAPLTVGLPVAKGAVRRGGKRLPADLRLRLLMPNGCLTETMNLIAAAMNITGRVGMRDHAERAKKHIQQSHKSGLRAGRYEVVEQALAQS